MKQMYGSLIAICCSALLACTANPTPPSPTTPGTSNQVVDLPANSTGLNYPLELLGSQQVPPVETTARAYGALSLNAERSQLSGQIYVSGLETPLTGAHLHQLSVSSQTGDIVKDLVVDGNTVSLNWRRDDASQALNAALLQALEAGELYLNLRSEAHPEGELRAGLMPSTDQIYIMKLSGSEQVPPVESTATGVVLLRLNAERSQLSLQGVVHGVESELSAAHLHQASAGANGEVLKAVQLTENELSLSWSNTDSEAPFDATALEQLLSGALYLNVHSADHPDGELRGQITWN